MDSREEYEERWMRGMMAGKVVHIVLLGDKLYIDGEQYQEIEKPDGK